jgi:hypothetical protein
LELSDLLYQHIAVLADKLMQRCFLNHAFSPPCWVANGGVAPPSSSLPLFGNSYLQVWQNYLNTFR